MTAWLCRVKWLVLIAYQCPMRAWRWSSHNPWPRYRSAPQQRSDACVSDCVCVCVDLFFSICGVPKAGVSVVWFKSKLRVSLSLSLSCKCMCTLHIQYFFDKHEFTISYRCTWTAMHDWTADIIWFYPAVCSSSPGALRWGNFNTYTHTHTGWASESVHFPQFTHLSS